MTQSSLEGTGLEVTHVNLLDGTVEGMSDTSSDNAFSGAVPSRKRTRTGGQRISVR